MHILCMITYKHLFVSNYLALAELIITAGGENIPPVPIEDALKEEVSIISNVMLIGDKKKFLSMLLTLKVSLCLLSETIKCAHFTKCLHLYQPLFWRKKKTLLRHHFENVCCYIFFLNDWILFLVQHWWQWGPHRWINTTSGGVLSAAWCSCQQSLRDH